MAPHATDGIFYIRIAGRACNPCPTVSTVVSVSAPKLSPSAIVPVLPPSAFWFVRPMRGPRHPAVPGFGVRGLWVRCLAPICLTSSPLINCLRLASQRLPVAPVPEAGVGLVPLPREPFALRSQTVRWKARRFEDRGRLPPQWGPGPKAQLRTPCSLRSAGRDSPGPPHWYQ